MANKKAHPHPSLIQLSQGTDTAQELRAQSQALLLLLAGAVPAGALGAHPDVPEHRESLEGSDSLRRAPCAATQTLMVTALLKRRRRDKPCRGTVHHQTCWHIIAVHVQLQNRSQAGAPGKAHTPHNPCPGQSFQQLLKSSCPHGVRSAQNSPRLGLVGQKSKTPKQVLRLTVEGEGKEGR